MPSFAWSKPLLALGSLLLALAGCGGGDGATRAEGAFAAPDRAVASNALGATAGTRRHALVGGTDGSGADVAVPRVAVTVDQFLNAVEGAYPEYFPVHVDTFDLTAGGVHYKVRYYPSTDNYAGVADDGTVYGYGAFTAYTLHSFGAMQQLACLVQPSLCNGGGGGGAYNECVDPQFANPPTGLQAHLIYQHTSGDFSGEQVVDTEVLGPTTFESQSAIDVRSVTTFAISIQGYSQTTTSTVHNFEQPSNGRLLSLGHTSESQSSDIVIGNITIPGTHTASKTVYNPADTSDVVFTLQQGQSATVTSSWATTLIDPPTGTTNGSETSTHTYVARETISVQGRSYDACKYTASTPGVAGVVTTWYLAGKGVPVRIVSEGSNTELKPGSTYAGQPL
jgi:hypothetical protein